MPKHTSGNVTITEDRSYDTELPYGIEISGRLQWITEQDLHDLEICLHKLRGWEITNKEIKK